MAETMKVYVNQDSLRAESEGVEIMAKGTKRGELCVVDFYTQMALEGRVFQVRAGTVTTHLAGGVEIQDTKADMCADAALGTTIMPIWLNLHIEALGGTVPIVCAKSVGAVSTAGAAFVPLPLLMGGNAAMSTARVVAAGGATVAAELSTTTRRHYSGTLATVDALLNWEPRTPPVLVGPACFYVQIAATTTGPNYFGNFDYIELPTINIS